MITTYSFSPWWYNNENKPSKRYIDELFDNVDTHKKDYPSNGLNQTTYDRATITISIPKNNFPDMITYLKWNNSSPYGDTYWFVRSYKKVGISKTNPHDGEWTNYLFTLELDKWVSYNWENKVNRNKKLFVERATPYAPLDITNLNRVNAYNYGYSNFGTYNDDEMEHFFNISKPFTATKDIIHTKQIKNVRTITNHAGHNHLSVINDVWYDFGGYYYYAIVNVAQDSRRKLYDDGTISSRTNNSLTFITPVVSSFDGAGMGNYSDYLSIPRINNFTGDGNILGVYISDIPPSYLYDVGTTTTGTKYPSIDYLLGTPSSTATPFTVNTPCYQLTSRRIAYRFNANNKTNLLMFLLYPYLSISLRHCGNKIDSNILDILPNETLSDEQNTSWILNVWWLNNNTNFTHSYDFSYSHLTPSTITNTILIENNLGIPVVSSGLTTYLQQNMNSMVLGEKISIGGAVKSTTGAIAQGAMSAVAGAGVATNAATAGSSTLQGNSSMSGGILGAIGGVADGIMERVNFKRERKATMTDLGNQMSNAVSGFAKTQMDEFIGNKIVVNYPNLVDSEKILIQIFLRGISYNRLLTFNELYNNLCPNFRFIKTQDITHIFFSNQLSKNILEYFNTQFKSGVRIWDIKPEYDFYTLSNNQINEITLNDFQDDNISVYEFAITP